MQKASIVAHTRCDYQTIETGTDATLFFACESRGFEVSRQAAGGRHKGQRKRGARRLPVVPLCDLASPRNPPAARWE